MDAEIKIAAIMALVCGILLGGGMLCCAAGCV